ncbi:unnamed protein product [Pseudo-nitzschia multistriata]|uniref:Radical SAM core domain-containing protein n=1 Tax=Pseudo-nitzschia multistriata TaxID=183589 RepID=A0A448Z897_9STRA|nr:unnamed protein product [Pseudo-nitzschia multistriata]
MMRRIGNTCLTRGVSCSKIIERRRLLASSSPSKSRLQPEKITLDRHHGGGEHRDEVRPQNHSPDQRNSKRERSTAIPRDGLSLSDFVHRARHGDSSDLLEAATTASAQRTGGQPVGTFHIKTYGCQMNVSDSDIVRAVLLENGYVEATLDNAKINSKNTINGNTRKQKKNRPWTPESTADIILTNTCAIREKAEEKVWQRLRHLRKNKGSHQVVGVLGCMAERLQNQLLEENVADLVVGPDAYRDLPRLLQQITGAETSATSHGERGNRNETTRSGDENGDDLQELGRQLLSDVPMQSETQQHRHHQDAIQGRIELRKPLRSKKEQKPRRPTAINVDLSTSETYDDIMPVRGDEASNPFSAFVSIQRGCSNRCSFCIVPFTRGGKERSRPFRSIVDEVSYMVETEDLKEVVLLGQNVNSYHDRSPPALQERPEQNMLSLSNNGFRSRIRRPNIGGYRFVDLVEAVADISPELRIRYTSPHPKDYPLELLQLMAERPNICSQLHMPAQSGSTEMLKRMKRGYTREAYIELIDAVRTVIPDVAISSDFIAGFCDETEEEHADTLSLLQYVEYEQAFLFAYSMRDKTHASRAMEDNVAADIKQRRLQELIDVFREKVHAKNERVEVGRLRLVLVEGPTKKQRADLPEGTATWHGRTDQNKRILFDVETNAEIAQTNATVWKEHHALEMLHQHQQQQQYFNLPLEQLATTRRTDLTPGDYAVVSVTEAKGHTLRGRMLWKTTLSDFARFESNHLPKLQQEDLNNLQENLFRGWNTNFEEAASLRAK